VCSRLEVSVQHPTYAKFWSWTISRGGVVGEGIGEEEAEVEVDGREVEVERVEGWDWGEMDEDEDCPIAKGRKGVSARKERNSRVLVDCNIVMAFVSTCFAV